MKASDIPNLITIVRIILLLPFLASLLSGHYLMALVIFAIAGISDGVDGFLAKHYGWVSRLGSILDPLADKLLLVFSFLALGFLGHVPFWLVLVVLARDVVIVVGALGYHLMFGSYEMEPSWISKLNTLVQIMLVLTVIISQEFTLLDEGMLYWAFATTLAVTLASGVSYIWVWGRRAIHMSEERDKSHE